MRIKYQCFFGVFLGFFWGFFCKIDFIIVITGKILGTGNISHKVSVSSFSISNAAAKKIIESGGEVLKFSEMIEKFPTGKGVKIIG